MFKKIFKSFFGITFLLTPSLATACSRMPFGNLSENSQNGIVKNYDEDYLYQEGCDEKDQFIASSDKNFHYFYGEATHIYSSYIHKGDKFEFNGNKRKLMNCTTKIPTKKYWRGQLINFQLIFVNKNNNKIKDLELKMDSKDFEWSDTEEVIEDKITGWARFLKFIDVVPGIKTSKHLNMERTLIPDIIGDNKLNEMKHDVQPIYLSLRIGKNVKAGLNKINLSFNYTINNVLKEIKIPFEFKIDEKILDVNDPEDDFGFSVQSFPADGLSWWGLENYGQVQISEGPDYHRPGFLKNDESRKALGLFLKPLKAANNQVGFGTGFHKQLIQYVAYYKNPENLSWEEVNKKIRNTNFEELMNKEGKNFRFEFIVDSLLDYLQVLTEADISDLMLSLVETGKFDSWLVLEGHDKGPETTFNTTLVNKNNGKLTSDFAVYEKYILKPLLNKINKEINLGYKNNKFINEFGKKSQVYVDTDELNESAMTTIQSAINEINKNEEYKSIRMHSFVGWRSSIDLKNSNYLNNNFVNSFDRYVFHMRELSDEVRNSGRDHLREWIAKRKANGLKTMYYSSFSDYPGSYIGSDTSEIYWNIFNARSLGLDGFMRWAYDKVYDDYYEKEIFTSSGTSEIREPGQSFLIYGGSLDKGVKYSVRMKALISAVEVVKKINYLINNNIDSEEIKSVLNSIGFSPYGHNNDKYKWYPNKKFNYTFKKPTEKYKKTVSMQVYELIDYIDKK